MDRYCILIIALFQTVFLSMGCSVKYTNLKYPECLSEDVVDTLHGVEVRDPYRWLENSDDSLVQMWTNDEDRFSHKYLNTLPQRWELIKCYSHLLRYDYEGTPIEVLEGNRLFYYATNTNWDRRKYFTKEREGAEGVLLLDPNEWGGNTLGFTFPSRDGKYVAYGVGMEGKEHFKVRVLDVFTKKILPDTLRGNNQRKISWLPDNTGFYYEATPNKGEVPTGEENYWFTIWLHKLGTPSCEDKKIFFDEKVKEYIHTAYVTEDGHYVILKRKRNDKTEVFLQKIGCDEDMKTIVTGFHASYTINEYQGKLIINTDLNAPRGKVYITDVDKPEEMYWKLLIPETGDILQNIIGIGGRLYAIYLHNAYTRIKIFSLDGKYLRDLPLPTIGSATIYGFWSKPTVLVIFQSFNYIPTSFKYKYTSNDLVVFQRPPIDIDISYFKVEQIWYKSKDSTKIPMFIIYNPKIKKNGNNPVYLYGYGGFNYSLTPLYDLQNAVWLKNGGMIAIPNLRGGGEFGEEWHRAGMLENKQNVFDDFISAAEWLINNKYTNSNRLVIGGGSNAGLLVGAVIVQRPDLFRAATCEVPILDMIRYHKYLYANIWSSEYGSSEDPEQFKYLLKYSPYHNVIKGKNYPGVLFITRDNDDRTPSLHVLKMVARMQNATIGGMPIILLYQKKSGHSGGTRISERIGQYADKWSYLMNAVNLPMNGK